MSATRSLPEEISLYNGPRIRTSFSVCLLNSEFTKIKVSRNTVSNESFARMLKFRITFMDATLFVSVSKGKNLKTTEGQGDNSR